MGGFSVPIAVAEILGAAIWRIPQDDNRVAVNVLLTTAADEEK